MPKLLLSLRGVPEDEAAEIDALLSEHGIDHYLVPPGNWGISGGGIWINDESRLVEAQALNARYQVERAARARADFEAGRRDGSIPSFWQLLRAHPLRMLVQLLVIVFMFGLCTLPFLWLTTR